jgi:hypothetical protein
MPNSTGAAVSVPVREQRCGRDTREKKQHTGCRKEVPKEKGARMEMEA